MILPGMRRIVGSDHLIAAERRLDNMLTTTGDDANEEE
jgi:hypothetical protein